MALWSRKDGTYFNISVIYFSIIYLLFWHVWSLNIFWIRIKASLWLPNFSWFFIYDLKLFLYIFFLFSKLYIFYHITVNIYFNKKIKWIQTNFSMIQLIKVIPMFSLLNFAHYINIKFLLLKKVRSKRNEFSQIETFSSFKISLFY